MSVINYLLAFNFLKAKNQGNFFKIVKTKHPVDIALMLSRHKDILILKRLEEVEAKKKALIFSYFDESLQQRLMELMSEKQIAEILDNMSLIDAADVFREIDKNRKEKILSLIKPDKSKSLLEISSYDDDDTGSIMTYDYISFKNDVTVRQAIDLLKIKLKDKENINEIYILNNRQKLIGVISLRDLLLSDYSLKLEKLINVEKEIITVKDKDSREETALKFSKYDMNSLPVVDNKNRMIGIVTGEQAIEVVEDEMTEDFLKSASISEIEGNISEASFFTLYKKRVFWLVLLVFGNILSGSGIAYFENTISKNIALVFFLPLLIDSAGNAGSQSATLMIRALAVGDVVFKDLGKMFVKEIFVSLGLGISMAIAVSFIGFYRGGKQIALVVSSTMVLTVIIGSLVGFLLPFLLSKFKLDPATASSPLITTLADSLGVVIYFTVATYILGI